MCALSQTRRQPPTSSRNRALGQGSPSLFSNRIPDLRPPRYREHLRSALHGAGSFSPHRLLHGCGRNLLPRLALPRLAFPVRAGREANRCIGEGIRQKCCNFLTVSVGRTTTHGEDSPGYFPLMNPSKMMDVRFASTGDPRQAEWIRENRHCYRYPLQSRCATGSYAKAFRAMTVR